jgi:hypothetical protein
MLTLQPVAEILGELFWEKNLSFVFVCGHGLLLFHCRLLVSRWGEIYGIFSSINEVWPRFFCAHIVIECFANLESLHRNFSLLLLSMAWNVVWPMLEPNFQALLAPEAVMTWGSLRSLHSTPVITADLSLVGFCRFSRSLLIWSEPMSQ